MPRLPIPGDDAGQWGGILNDYLLQAHNADGTLRNNSVGPTQLQSGAVHVGNLSSSLQSQITQVQDAIDNPVDYNDLTNQPTLGTAASTDATDYATAAQGVKADTAVHQTTLRS